VFLPCFSSELLASAKATSPKNNGQKHCGSDKSPLLLLSAIGENGEGPVMAGCGRSALQHLLSVAIVF